MQTTNQQCGTFNDLVTACENLHKFTRHPPGVEIVLVRHVWEMTVHGLERIYH